MLTIIAIIASVVALCLHLGLGWWTVAPAIAVTMTLYVLLVRTA